MEDKFFHIRPLKLIPKNKKGLGIGDLYPVVLTIALVAILIAVVMFILDEIGETTATDLTTVTNESGWINTSGYSFSHANSSTCKYNAFRVTTAWNYTENNGTTIPTTEYVVAENDGFVIAAAGESYPLVNMTYTYLSGGADCAVTETIADDFIDFIPWIGVILLIVAAAIVLGILMRSFGGREGRV